MNFKTIMFIMLKQSTFILFFVPIFLMAQDCSLLLGDHPQCGGLVDKITNYSRGIPMLDQRLVNGNFLLIFEFVSDYS